MSERCLGLVDPPLLNRVARLLDEHFGDLLAKVFKALTSGVVPSRLGEGGRGIGPIVSSNGSLDSVQRRVDVGSLRFKFVV